MPPKKKTSKTAKTQAPLPEPTDDAVFTDDVDGPTEEEDDFASFLYDIGTNAASVDVIRIPKTGDPEWMDNVPLDTIKEGLTALRDQFGPGKYRLRFKDAQKSYVKHKTVTIGDIPGRAAVPTFAGGSLEAVEARLLRDQLTLQQTLLMKIIDGTMARPQAAGTDSAAMLTAVIGAFSVLKNASEPATAAGNPVKQLKETLELMTNAKDLFGGGEAKEENLYSLIRDVSKKLFEPVPGGRPPASNGLPPGFTATPVTSGTVQTIHPGTQSRVIPAPSGAPAPPLPESASAGAPPPDVNSTPQEQIIQWIHVGLDYLKTKAKLGKDVKIYQDLLFDHEEEPQFSAILQAIEHGATFENLLQFDEEIANTPQLREWFSKLYESLRTDILSQRDSTGTAGDADHPGSHEGPGSDGQSDAGN